MIDINKNSFSLTINKEQYMKQIKWFMSKKITPPQPFIGITNGSHEYTCKTGHCNIIKQARDSNLPYVIVFEDDAFPCDNCKFEFNSLIQHMEEKQIKWDMLLIGICGEHGDGKVIMGNNNLNYHDILKSDNLLYIDNKLVQIKKFVHGSQAYVVKQSAYDELIYNIETKQEAMDYQLVQNNFKSNIVITSLKMLFCQRKESNGNNTFWYPYFYNEECKQVGPTQLGVNVIPKGFSI